ncbi:MAG: hypothetical protein OXC62_14975 [Aestuariivita sp.]|nr:hypothetical protein [Aestuariivita sp.]
MTTSIAGLISRGNSTARRARSKAVYEIIFILAIQHGLPDAGRA